ncbi:PH domain-containing protein [Formosa sp. PL04]|uniref:PH domain-containing protein n=1 Tax=Formosa sp. PL04 TaxID=3081755 RepID=UPI002980C692|nr:PH domain-containing protein [Formosa sp. PL04]MDW5290799.1 PH domain-containing protein [Formosa sp. PL04]
MKTYKSKIGFEILIIEILIFGSIIIFMVFQDQPIEAILSVSGILALVFTLCLYLNLSTEYIIYESGNLKIKTGIFYSKVVEINKIKSIAKSSNFVSSPAPSLDRIELTYGKFDVIIISPKQKIEFAQALIKLNPSIENKLSQ